jgi:hypothetical protein
VIRSTFGQQTPIQRCQIHKARLDEILTVNRLGLPETISIRIFMRLLDRFCESDMR